jgi:hypothetical protein
MFGLYVALTNVPQYVLSAETFYLDTLCPNTFYLSIRLVADLFHRQFLLMPICFGPKCFAYVPVFYSVNVSE